MRRSSSDEVALANWPKAREWPLPDPHPAVTQELPFAPAAFWEPVARCELHWLHAERAAWLSKAAEAPWTGWDAVTAEPVESHDSWVPW